MQHLIETLPNNVTVDLYYAHDYPGGPFDYFQHARTHTLFRMKNLHQIEEAYWDGLQQNRTAFANQIVPGFDLIIDAPSNSGWHRPFVSAVRARFPAIPCISFIKDPINAAIIRAYQNLVPGLAQATRVLIVDDLYSTGTMAAAIIHRLHGYGLDPAVPFDLACPLRIPPQPGGSFDDIADAVEAMNQEDAAQEGDKNEGEATEE